LCLEFDDVGCRGPRRSVLLSAAANFFVTPINLKIQLTLLRLARTLIP